MRRHRTEPNLTEWVVLAVAAEGPTHGWAIARLLGKGGPLGEAWSSSRPLVYRAIERLEAAGLLRRAGRSEGRGPDREILEITRAGVTAVEAWLCEPVDHVRDVRTTFLVKVLLLDRRGQDVGPLVRGQREQLASVVARLAAQAAEAQGSERIVAAWRAINADAVMRFLATLEETAGR